jgi:tetratricopeptide (TPR) repeat protein
MTRIPKLSYMEVAMPSGSSKRLLLAVNLLAATALLIGAAGCADSLIYAKDARNDGLALYNQGEYGEAAACFANATRQDPRDYRSYYYLGATYDAMNSYQQAIEAYRSCLDVMPLTLEGANNGSFRMRAVDSLATSIAHSDSHGLETAALEKKCAGHASVEDQWLLAKIYRYTGDADAAVDSYNKAVLIAPQNFLLAKEAGLYDQSLGQSQRATYALKRAYAVNPDDMQVNSALRQLGVSMEPLPSRQQFPQLGGDQGAGPAASIEAPSN